MPKGQKNPPGMRYCCGPCKRLLELSPSNFNKDGSKSDGMGYVCKQCIKIRPRNKVWEREYHLKTYYRKTYNLTNEGLQRKINEQNGCCAICHESFNKDLRRPCVDHDHTTGMIRGILCHTCNDGLGKFKDNIPFLESAIDYLRRYQR